MSYQYGSLLLCSKLFNQVRPRNPSTLPLKNKRLLNHCIHSIRQTNLPINYHTRICSRHFVNTKGRRLYSDEDPSLCLPKSSITRVPKNMCPVRTEHAAITAHSVQLLVFCTAHACLPSVSRLVSRRLNPKFHPLHTCINNSV